MSVESQLKSAEQMDMLENLKLRTAEAVYKRLQIQRKITEMEKEEDEQKKGVAVRPQQQQQQSPLPTSKGQGSAAAREPITALRLDRKRKRQRRVMTAAAMSAAAVTQPLRKKQTLMSNPNDIDDDDGVMVMVNEEKKSAEDSDVTEGEEEEQPVTQKKEKSSSGDNNKLQRLLQSPSEDADGLDTTAYIGTRVAPSSATRDEYARVYHMLRLYQATHNMPQGAVWAEEHIVAEVQKHANAPVAADTIQRWLHSKTAKKGGRGATKPLSGMSIFRINRAVLSFLREAVMAGGGAKKTTTPAIIVAVPPTTTTTTTAAKKEEEEISLKEGNRNNSGASALQTESTEEDEEEESSSSSDDSEVDMEWRELYLARLLQEGSAAINVSAGLASVAGYLDWSKRQKDSMALAQSITNYLLSLKSTDSP